MAVLFGTKPGTGKGYIVNFDDSGVTPALIQLPQVENSSFGDTWKSTVILTSAGLNQQANVQYMHTLREHIYIYSFGQRMGAMQINGVLLWDTCDGSANAKSGLWAIMKFYKSWNVGTQLTPVTIILGAKGSVNVSGFLDNMATTFSDPEKGLTGFRMHFSTLPTLWLNT